MSDFEVKDSGERKHFDSGMVRDTTEGKRDYLLVRDGPMYERWAEHLTKGARKYTKRNWMQANGPEELERFRQSAVRHFEAWLRGETDEDHAAAVFFNINGVEYVREQMHVEGLTFEEPGECDVEGFLVDLNAALDALADSAYESGLEIGEVIERRRGRDAASLPDEPCPPDCTDCAYVRRCLERGFQFPPPTSIADRDL